MTDLIERLRDEPTWHEKKHGLPRPAMEVWHQTSLEAANEIERLTAIVESPSAVIIQAGVWHARLDEIERLTAERSELIGLAIQVLGWTWADACAKTDAGLDIRKHEIPELLARVQIDIPELAKYIVSGRQ